MRGIRIRDYQEADCAFVVGLSGATQQEMHRMDPDRHPPVLPGEAAKWFEEGLRASWARASLIYIAELDGKPAGYVITGPANEPWNRGSQGHPPPRRSGEIPELHMVKRHRGEGVGTALLDAAEQGLANRGFAEVILGHLARNKIAASLYTSRGYSPRWVLQVKRLRPRG